MPLLYPNSCFHKNQHFFDGLMSNLREESFSRLPPHSSPTATGRERVGIKGQSSTEGPWGPHALPRPGRPASILLSTTADMQDTTSREGAHGTWVLPMLPPQLEGRERKLEKKKENWRSLQVTELELQLVGRGEAGVGLVRPPEILLPQHY